MRRADPSTVDTAQNVASGRAPAVLPQAYITSLDGQENAMTSSQPWCVICRASRPPARSRRPVAAASVRAEREAAAVGAPDRVVIAGRVDTTARAAPPVAGISQMSAEPPRFEPKAIHAPSGDQRGSQSWAGCSVRPSRRPAVEGPRTGRADRRRARGGMRAKRPSGAKLGYHSGRSVARSRRKAPFRPCASHPQVHAARAVRSRTRSRPPAGRRRRSPPGGRRPSGDGRRRGSAPSRARPVRPQINDRSVRLTYARRRPSDERERIDTSAGPCAFGSPSGFRSCSHAKRPQSPEAPPRSG